MPSLSPWLTPIASIPAASLSASDNTWVLMLMCHLCIKNLFDQPDYKSSWCLAGRKQLPRDLPNVVPPPQEADPPFPFGLTLIFYRRQELFTWPCHRVTTVALDSSTSSVQLLRQKLALARNNPQWRSIPTTTDVLDKPNLLEYRGLSSTHRTTQQWHMPRATHIALFEGWPYKWTYIFTCHSKTPSLILLCEK